MPSTKRKAAQPPTEPTSKRVKSPNDHRTLVCVVRGIPGRVFTVTIDANAPIHHLKDLIHDENSSHLSHVTTATMDVYSTQNFPGGWAKLTPKGFLVDMKDPSSISPLLPTKSIRHYFPSDIPAFDSGVVHVVAEISQTEAKLLVEVLPDEIPTPDETVEEEIDRMGRLREALGLCTTWSMGESTDFSKKHKYQGAQWIQYEHYADEGRSRVFIGDKTTWKELYIAANEAVEKVEGRVMFRYIESIDWLIDGVIWTLALGRKRFVAKCSGVPVGELQLCGSALLRKHLSSVNIAVGEAMTKATYLSCLPTSI